MPDVTFTVPVLLNSVLMVEVAALPLLVNVPALFTAAVTPVSPLPWLVAKIVSPARRLIGERRPAHDRQRARAHIADAGVRIAAVQIDLNACPARRAGAAQLQRPTTVQAEACRTECCTVLCNRRPGTALRPTREARSRNGPVPVTVNVPVPLSSPPDCVSPPVVTVPLKVAVPAVIVIRPVPAPPLTVVNVVALPANSALPVMLDVASNVRVPPRNSMVPAPA